jgi:hypothetical protein
MSDILQRFGIAALASCSLVCTSATASAEYATTYEIVSNDIGMVDLEFVDADGRQSLRGVPLPWRADAVLQTTDDTTPVVAELRAAWRPNARPSRWVTVRIYRGGKVICQSTLDIGNATCYGNTPHFS